MSYSNMKKLYLLMCLLFFGYLAVSQTSKSSLESINSTRIDKTKTGMLILGGWAIGNMLTSPLLASRASGSAKYFHQMNGYWNIINLGIAGFGYYGLLRQDPSALSLAQSIAEQQKIENMLLFNTGLDVAYVIGGLYMYERAKNVSKNADRLKGFGQSVMLQGGFLLVFDLIFYLTMNKHGKLIDGLIDNIQLTGNSISLIFKL
ncbi:MAG: hypothetical protein WBA74_21835 [Cyclobacteriaceae bacterium]